MAQLVSDMGAAGSALYSAIIPPPPGPVVVPNLSLGLNHYAEIYGERPFRNRLHWIDVDIKGAGQVVGFTSLWATDLKSAFQKIEDGELDPATGFCDLAAGEVATLPRVRWLQTEGHPDLDVGKYVFSFEITPGSDISLTGGGGWVEENSTATIKRYVRNFTAIETGASNPQLTALAPSTFRGVFLGLEEDELIHDVDPWTDHFREYVAGYDLVRPMDWMATNQSRATRADHMVRSDDWIWRGDGSQWGGPLAANDTNRRTGFNHGALVKLVAPINVGLHMNVPPGFGAYLTYGDPAASYAGVNSRINIAQNDTYANAIESYFPAILTAAKVEYTTLFTRWVQDLVDHAYPDDVPYVIELTNEGWAGQFSQQSNYLLALEKHLRSGPSRVGPKLPRGPRRGGGGMGYLLALVAWCAQQVFDVLKPNQRVEYVFGCQTPTAPDEFTQSAVEGWELYEAEFPTESLPVGMLSGATTGYISGGFKWDKAGITSPLGNPWQARTEAAFNVAFQASLALGEANLFNDIEQWYFNPNVKVNHSIYAALFNSQKHALFLVSRGAKYFGQYEGSFHEDIQTGAGTLSSILGLNFMNALRNRFLQSPNAYRIQQRYIQEMFALFPTAFISNYHEVSAVQHMQAWTEKTADKMNVYVPNTASAAWDEFKIGVAPPPVPPPPPPPVVIQPPAIPVGDTSLYGAMASVFGSIIGQMQTGTCVLNRHTVVRAQPWQKATTDTIQLYALVAYVGGEYYVKKEGRWSTKRKLMISGPHLQTIVHPTDTIVIDGLEYSIDMIKRVPRAGAVVMFWNVECSLNA